MPDTPGAARRPQHISKTHHLTMPDAPPAKSPRAYDGATSPSEEEVIELDHDDGSDEDFSSELSPDALDAPREPPKEPPKETKPGDPAYVAPIGKIQPISPVSQIKGIDVSPGTRPRLPQFVGSFLKGKVVNEAGEITDPGSGLALARAAGDLPSIIGRKVSNSQGDILGDDGELLGYVAELAIEKKHRGSNAASQPPAQDPPAAAPKPRSISEVMGRSGAGLMVDHLGNILDSDGNVVGRFHDNNNPLHQFYKEHKQDRPPSEQEAGKQPVPEQDQEQERRGEQAEEKKSEEKGGGGGGYTRRSESERMANAQAWRKENPEESPSDIFLDVKSTTDGIQLTIRIPTIFNGDRRMEPKIQFS